MGSLQWTNPLENKTRLPSQMTKVDCPRKKLREWLTTLKHSRPKMRSIRNLSLRNVMKSSNGSMPTNWLRLMSLQTSKRKSKASAIQSLLNYTNKQEEHPEVCQVVCPEVCQVVCQEEREVPQVPVVQEDQPSKKSIKYQIKFYHLVYLSNGIYSNSHSTNFLIAC